MSTKIFYAYKYNGLLEELLSDLKKVRKEYYDIVFAEMNHGIWLIKDNKEKYKRVKEIQEFVLRELSGEVAIYLCETYFYCQFFCAPHILNQIKLSDKFIDFHYQNQTDRPSKIKVKEWKERERIWDKIFDDTSIPALDGLTFEILDKSMSENLIIDLLKVK